jgi:hypothetical protein
MKKIKYTWEYSLFKYINLDYNISIKVNKNMINNIKFDDVFIYDIDSSIYKRSKVNLRAIKSRR